VRVNVLYRYSLRGATVYGDIAKKSHIEESMWIQIQAFSGQFFSVRLQHKTTAILGTHYTSKLSQRICDKFHTIPDPRLALTPWESYFYRISTEFIETTNVTTVRQFGSCKLAHLQLKSHSAENVEHGFVISAL